MAVPVPWRGRLNLAKSNVEKKQKKKNKKKNVKMWQHFPCVAFALSALFAFAIVVAGDAASVAAAATRKNMKTFDRKQELIRLFLPGSRLSARCLCRSLSSCHLRRSCSTCYAAMLLLLLPLVFHLLAVVVGRFERFDAIAKTYCARFILATFGPPAARPTVQQLSAMPTCFALAPLPVAHR